MGKKWIFHFFPIFKFLLFNLKRVAFRKLKINYLTDKLGFEYVIVLNRCRGRRPRLPEEKNAIQQFHNGQSRTPVPTINGIICPINPNLSGIKILH